MSDNATDNHDNNPISSKSSSLMIYLFILALFIGLILSTSYLFFTKKQLANQLNQQSETISTVLEKFQQQSNKTLILDQLKMSQDQLREHIDQLGKKFYKTIQQSQYQKQDWQLLKGRYYLELAQINNHWTDDKATSIALLEQANDLLASLSNPSLLAVRQAIAKEIALLEAIPTLDITGLLSQLDAADQLLSSLKVHLLPNQLSEHATEENNIPVWQQKLQSNLKPLEKLIVIHHDEDLPSSFLPYYQILLRESIHLNLQQAQWALLERNTTAYQFALSHAIKEITRVANSSEASALIKQLTNLAQQTLSVEKLPLNESLLLLNQVIESNPPPVEEESTKEGDHS